MESYIPVELSDNNFQKFVRRLHYQKYQQNFIEKIGLIHTTIEIQFIIY